LRTYDKIYEGIDFIRCVVLDIGRGFNLLGKNPRETLRIYYIHERIHVKKNYLEVGLVLTKQVSSKLILINMSFENSI